MVLLNGMAVRLVSRKRASTLRNKLGVNVFWAPCLYSHVWYTEDLYTRKKIAREQIRLARMETLLSELYEARNGYCPYQNMVIDQWRKAIGESKVKICQMQLN